ncbi:hypothetical protein GCM10010470_63490 [Saccharopolyspora taberi]|uniref:Uncharacterized protein n=1 Tax=Saccharopolyspora taberi TaxID=60895 RepID=A0ABN3VPM1_9PSEU
MFDGYLSVASRCVGLDMPGPSGIGGEHVNGIPGGPVRKFDDAENSADDAPAADRGATGHEKSTSEQE